MLSDKGTKYKFYIERFTSAVCRESFNGKFKRNNTPISVTNSSKYLITVSDKEVFILAPKKLFEEVLTHLYELSKQGEKGKDGAIELLEKLYRSEKFRGIFENWEQRSWTNSLDEFI